MHVTLTFDDDIVDRLHDKIRHSGRSLNEVVNQTLRADLNSVEIPNPQRMKWRKAPLQIGVRFVSSSELLERLDVGEDNPKPS